MIAFARHGHVHNPSGVLYGNRPGYYLSALGRAQASALGDHLRRLGVHPAAVYSSPLERAVETAAIATGRNPVRVAALADWEPEPEWVGVPWADIPLRFPDRFATFMAAPWIDPAAATRAVRAIASGSHNQTVLVVGHQDPIRAVLNALLPVPMARLRDDPLPQCALRIVDPATWRVVYRWDPPAASAWPASGR